MSSLDQQKWIISAWSALPFLLLASPQSFKLTNKLLSPLGLRTSVMGCPTTQGLLLHTLVFLLVTRLMMSVRLPGVM